MKHPTAKRSEKKMRFFTPELYQLFNSSDDDKANRADELWERATRDYRKHLDSIRHTLPSQVWKLAELCLHDFEVLGYDEKVQSMVPLPEPFSQAPFWTAVAILTLKQRQTLHLLIYVLWDRAREHPAMEDWQFSKARKHWLYDEIDVAANHRNRFVHRILFSDGTVFEIPFVSVIVSTVELPAKEKAGVSRRSA
jgi:hypothetical protein